MSYVGQGPGLKTTNIKRFDVTGSTSATHVLSWTAPSEQTLWITINGVKQQDDAYTIAGSPTTVTLSSALVSADKLEIIGVVDMGVSTYPVDGSVSTASLGNTSVTTAKIAADAVTATEIATGAVGTTEIAANAVDTSEIAADAVGLTEMAGLARGKLIVGDASGDPSALTVGTADQVLTSNGTDVSWQDSVGGAAWVIKTAGYTAVAGDGVMVDTSSSAITITLPISSGPPSLGDFVRVLDVTGDAATNNITVARNGNNIQGAAADLTIATNRAAIGLVYVNATEGWVLIEN